MALTTIGLMALLGCFTGFMAGLLGIGGGMIITPFLIMLIPSSLIPHDHIVHVAIATSLATIAFTSLSSVRAHHKRGAVLWNVVASVAPHFGRCGCWCTDRRLAADILAVFDFCGFRRVLRVQDVFEQISASGPQLAGNDR